MIEPTITALEGPDEPITLVRAAEIAGLPVTALRMGAYHGHLPVERHGVDLRTTRRWLHRYLRSRNWLGRRSAAKRALPAGYVTPDGEEPIS